MRTTQAIQAVKAMQIAARRAAQGKPNLGLDPARPGIQLPNVPNGLGPGGLQVAQGVPATLPTNGIPGIWTGAKLPTQKEKNGETIVTIVQEQSKALLTWETFNIGEETTLKFDQSAGGSDSGKWIAFNKINDPTGVPSQILGSIKADGQVYVINPNGIIFGGTSQVNLHVLVASSLPINDKLIQNGLLNNPDAEFLFSATTFGSETGPAPIFNTPDGRVGDVIVQEGARLSAPTTPDKVGGRIALVGANVRNEGTISTPDGQTILAAGLQVGFDAHPSSDPSLRGLDVYIGSVSYPEGGTQPPAGTATNDGLINAARANVTIAGKKVVQGGVINSSTSSALNGRVDLVANYGATSNPGYEPTDPQSGTPFSNRISGTVKIEEGSVIRILPKLASTEQAIGTTLALPSQVNIQGKAIHFANDSLLLAPNANVTVSAGNWVEPSAAAQTVFRFTGGQIYFDPGATISVAGSIDVSAPISNNILTLELRGTELAYSPLQREGVLRGPTISVDLRYSGIYNGFAWIGTPLGDVSGYAGIIQRSVGELTAAGGTVTLNAGESVVMQPGSVIDVSGGWINYQGGMVQTSRVLSGGTLYDLSQANPGRIYDGVYLGSTTTFDSKYGILETFSHPLALTGLHYEDGYMHGANAGTITINAPSMALDGTLEGHAVQGPRQSNLTAIALAKDGTLNINFRAQEALPPYFSYSPTPPTVIFGHNPSQISAAPFSLEEDGTPTELIAERKETVYLSPELLTEQGFGTLAVDNSDGRISIPEGVELTAPVQGTISLRAANLDIAGNVSAPGGALSFNVFNLSPYTLIKLNANNNTAVTPPPDPNRGIFTLGPHAVLSTAGFITDYRPGTAGDSNLPPLIQGGSISINAYTANLAVGSAIDVSGGVSIDSAGVRKYGNAGAIAINAGRDPGLTWLIGGELALGSTLRGYSGAIGGSLTIQAPMIQIGGTLPPLIPTQGEDGPHYFFGDIRVGRDELLYLTPDFFTQGGFGSYTLNGLGKAIDAASLQFLPAISIAPGTVIHPIAESLLAVPGVPGESVTLQPILKPEGLRNPVSLTFGSSTTQNRFLPKPENILRGDIVVGAGALIETDPRASVTFRGSTVAIFGSVLAPGGSITVSGADVFPLYVPGDPPDELKMALPTVHLAPGSILSAAGETLLTPDPYGRRIGIVLPGGTIVVSGNIVAEAGAVLDVSGTSGILDLAPGTLVQNIAASDSLNGNRAVALNSGLTAPLYRLQTVPASVDSDAGTIVLKGGQELFTDATLLGFAGGPAARGGFLSISSGRYIDPVASGAQSGPFDINLIVQQSGPTIVGTFYPNGGTAIGYQVPVGDGDAALGLGHFAVSSFSQGGFDSLSLSGQGANLTGGVGFSGPIFIKAMGSLAVSNGGVIFTDSAVHLEASYVALGTAFESPLLPTQTDSLSFGPSIYGQPTFGRGSLKVRASLIDIGKLSLQNIGRTTLIADGGDIRGNGTLSAAGEVEFRAGQVYPTTGNFFTVSVYDPNIAILNSSTSSAQVTLASTTLPPGFGIGSPLLGSTVVAIDGASVTLAANANASVSARTLVTFAPGEGTVTVTGSGVRPMPYSAGGTLSIYASNIHQNGTLRAPFGTINLGWDGTGDSPIDYLTGAGILQGSSVVVTQQLTLGAGSVTSVSGVDPRTRTGLIIPYGFSPDGTAWIDPTGMDITSGGPPAKGVNLSAVDLTNEAGSVIDVRGGGDLYVYRWVTGTGGVNDLLGTAAGNWDSGTSYTAGQLVSYRGQLWSARRANVGVTPSISQDWTLLPQSFAVLPDYEAHYAPYAAFNDRVSTLNLALSDPGYVNPGLAVGSRVYLGASEGLAEGTYTLLPARYALLPGAVLVTPQTGSALGTFQMPEGASIVSGYRFNDFSAQQLSPVQATRFEVAPGDVVRARAQYDEALANTFFEAAARELGIGTPLLPGDSGKVVFAGQDSLQIQGHVLGGAIGGGNGAQVDISTPTDILISSGGAPAQEGTTVLDARLLSSFGADSILIGGTRQATATGTTITVRTSTIDVDNSGAALIAPEIILVAQDSLTLASDARIVQSGSTGGGRNLPLFIGDSAVAGSGDGLLLRVSDRQTQVIRSGVSSLDSQVGLPNAPVLTIGAGAIIKGDALTLDSTYGTSLDSEANVSGRNIALNSGQILIAFENATNVPEIAGLTLTGEALGGLSSSRTLSLLSYSSIDTYGTGTFQADGVLSLQAGQIRGFQNGEGAVTFSASQIVLGNLSDSAGQASVAPTGGSLIFDAETIRLGTGEVRVDQFANVQLRAADRVLAEGDGSFATQGGLAIESPLLTARRAVDYAINAAEALDVTAPEDGGGAVSGGLGASLSLTGASVLVNSDIVLPSGTLTLRATSGDLVVGDLGTSHLDTRGTAQTFYDLTRFTNGGRINLIADAGSVALDSQSEVSVAANADGGSAGTVSISAANGTFTLDGTLDGSGGKGGKGGSFALDVQSLSSTTPIDLVLNDASFDQARFYRVRTGNVSIDGLATSHAYQVSADQGSITVSGTGNLDASGETGGNIDLIAFGTVTVESGAKLSVAGKDFNSAGQGGTISLEAGSQQNGVVGSGSLDLQAGATLDLSVVSKVAFDPGTDAITPGTSAYEGKFSGKLHLRAPQNAEGTDLLVDVGSSRVDLQACKLEYSIVSPK